MFRKSLRQTLQNIPQKQDCPPGTGRLPDAGRFPRFVLCTSAICDEDLTHKINWVLQQISDNITFPTPTCALADLTHVQTHFGTTERLLQTLQAACTTSFSSRCLDLPAVRFFIGSHLFRSLIFADHFLHLSPLPENRNEEIVHVLGAENLQFRLFMRDLTWDKWLSGAHSLLSLFPFSSQALENHVAALGRFVASMISMRVRSPEAGRALWKGDEINRRFGALTAEVWSRFCTQNKAHTLHGTSLRQTELPCDVRQFTGHSRDTLTAAECSALPQGNAVPLLMACFEESLRRLNAHFPLVPYGIRDFEAEIRFTSGHSLSRRFLLNEAVQAVDRTSACILSDLFLSLLRPEPHGPAALTTPKSSAFARVTRGDGRHTEWHCVSTPHGLGLVDPGEPGVAHLLNAIESAQIVPLRICQMRKNNADTNGFLFGDPSEFSLSEDLRNLRRDLLAQDGIRAVQFQPRSSFRRPHATRPLFPSTDPTPLSNLFSHAFLHRPPVVLRQPLPFSLARWHQDLCRTRTLAERRAAPAPPDSHFQLLETLDHHDFYLLTTCGISYGLWLCAPVFERDLPPPEKEWNLLGFFDALNHLPAWVLP